MSKNYKKVSFGLLLVAILFITVTNLHAQVKIGLPATEPNPAAILDISNTGGGDKGFILPQVSLTNNNIWGLKGYPTEGLMVQNNALVSSGSTSVVPGIYVWANFKWMLISTTTHADLIAAGLNFSLDSYQAAAQDTWVSITAYEYFNIYRNVGSIKKYYSSDYELNKYSLKIDSNYSQTATFSQAMPANYYPIAVAISSGNNAPLSMAGIQLKLSTLLFSNYYSFPSSGIVTCNSSSPMAANNTYYWVLKSPTQKTLSETFAAAFFPLINQSSSYLGYDGGSFNGNSNYFVSTDYHSIIQFLATPIKSW